MFFVFAAKLYDAKNLLIIQKYAFDVVFKQEKESWARLLVVYLIATLLNYISR